MNKGNAGAVVRWILAVCLLGYGIVLLVSMDTKGGDSPIVFDKSVYAIASLLTGILCLAPEVVSWTILPLYYLIDRLLLPSESEPPPANFKLARYYVAQGRYDEAAEEYAKIVRYHPEVAGTYLEGIRAASLAGDSALAKKFYRWGKRVLRSSDERRLLKGVYYARHEPEVITDEEPPADEAPTDETAVVEPSA